MTLKDFVKKNGGLEKSARAIGVSWATVFRWYHGKSKPSFLALEKFKELGIEMGE